MVHFPPPSSSSHPRPPPPPPHPCVEQVQQLPPRQGAGHGQPPAQGLRHTNRHTIRHGQSQEWRRRRRDHDQVCCVMLMPPARCKLPPGHHSPLQQLAQSCTLPHAQPSATATGGTVLLEFGLLSRISGAAPAAPTEHTHAHFTHASSPHGFYNRRRTICSCSRQGSQGTVEAQVAGSTQLCQICAAVLALSCARVYARIFVTGLTNLRLFSL